MLAPMKLFSVFCILSFLAIPLTAQDKIEIMVNRLKTFGSKIAQEQVFLHLDNSSYYLGDTIFYKVYVSRGDNGRPTNLSGIVYCELLNNDGYLVERQMIPLENGEGFGNFSLADTMLYAGYYELRAYTRWQLNWGVMEQPHSPWIYDYFFNNDMVRDYYRDYEKLYSRVFPVYDTPNTPGDYTQDMTLRPLADYHKADNAKRAMVQFFPEGGSLVVGTKQRVAWEARDEQGQTLEGALSVALPNGGAVTSETVNRGRGVFELEVSRESALTGVFIPYKSEDSENPAGVPEAAVKLPRAVKNGVAMRMEVDEEGITISCLATDTASQQHLGLTIMRDGVLQHFRILDGSPVHFTPTEAGVYQATVFNEEGRIYADRLAFFLPRDLEMENVKIQTEKGMCEPFESIELNLEGAPGASMSLAVRDAAHSEFTYDTGTMLTERLLASQIRGFVPHPQWFFQKNDPQRRQALDLLLMVQGWRKYSWRQMAVSGEFELEHRPETRYPYWTGQVHKYSAPTVLNDFEQAGRAHSEASSDAMAESSGVREESSESIPSNTSTKNSNSDGSNADQSRHHKRESSLKYPVALHADFTQPGNDTQVDGCMKTQGTFSMDFPRFYESYFFFLSASDTTKWKDGKAPVWNALAKGSSGVVEYPEFYVKLDCFYPRFPKPYDYYQQHVSPMPKNHPLYNSMDEKVRMLSEVTVGARRGGRRTFRQWRPAMIVDFYEAFNATCDAGISSGIYPGRDAFVYDVARTYLGDMGTQNEYEIIMRLDGKTVMGRSAYQVARQATDLPSGAIPESESFSTASTKDKYNYPWELKDVYIYTDFSPRNAHRNVGGNRARPQVTVDLRAMPDGGHRRFYKNRRWIMKGFSVPDEFYSPDYSRQPLPKEDHRRTLYWNPSIKLDEEGKATVTFYNNSSKTLLQVSVEGWTQDGVPQCAKIN